ncbi:MAG: hypothetical protein ABI142_14070, partial [Bryocella sp.]
LVYPASVAKLGLTSLTATKQREHFAITDGGVDMLKAAAHEDFDGKPVGSEVFFATPQVHVPAAGIDAAVGMRALSGHTVTFDFAASCFALY